MVEKQKEIKIHKKESAIYANRLLERAPDPNYITEWTSLLAKKAPDNQELHERSVILFRIGKEWLALSAKNVSEIIEKRPIHQIPHKTNQILRGVVNLKGQLKLCISMHDLLAIKPIKENHEDKLLYKRMLAIEHEGQTWLFGADEVFGVAHFDAEQIENVPVTLSKSTVNYLQGVIPWKGVNVGYLDSELLFATLQRSL